MSSPAESASLLLQLFELRRDPVMRTARDWFVRDFNPTSYDEVIAALGGEHNPHFRMVAGYWDMACSFVVHGAIDWQMFIDANPEAIPAFAKWSRTSLSSGPGSAPITSECTGKRS